MSTLTDYFSDVLSGKKKSTTLGNPQAINVDGLLMDVDVQPVNDDSSTHEDKWQDVDNFFCMTVVKEVNGKSRSIICAKYACEFMHQHFVMYTDMISRGNKSLVDEVMTL